MAGRVEHIERHALDRELVPFRKPHRHDVDLALLAHDGDAMGAVAQRAEPGDVIGVQVGVDRLDELELELVDELDIAVDFLQDRIDDERLAAPPAGHEISVGARYRVEELAKNHRCVPPKTRILKSCSPSYFDLARHVKSPVRHDTSRFSTGDVGDSNAPLCRCPRCARLSHVPLPLPELCDLDGRAFEGAKCVLLLHC